jgi:hypothetical protein
VDYISREAARNKTLNDLSFFFVKCFTNRDLSNCLEMPSLLFERHFKSLFLYMITEVTAHWASLDMRPGFPGATLWTLYYMKVYPTWDQMAVITGTTEKTLCKWVIQGADYLDSIHDWVSAACSVLCVIPCTTRVQYLQILIG